MSSEKLRKSPYFWPLGKEVPVVQRMWRKSHFYSLLLSWLCPKGGLGTELHAAMWWPKLHEEPCFSCLERGGPHWENECVGNPREERAGKGDPSNCVWSCVSPGLISEPHMCSRDPKQLSKNWKLNQKEKPPPTEEIELVIWTSPWRLPTKANKQISILYRIWIWLSLNNLILKTFRI